MHPGKMAQQLAQQQQQQQQYGAHSMRFAPQRSQTAQSVLSSANHSSGLLPLSPQPSTVSQQLNNGESFKEKERPSEPPQAPTGIT